MEPVTATVFDICDNAGNPAFVERGLTPIPIGATTLNVPFVTRKASVNISFSELAVENLIDPNAISIDPEKIGVDINGFRVQFDGAPDTGNYFLRWNCYVTNL